MNIQNTTLDDVAAVIGFSATLRLAAWFGGRTQNLYVPQQAAEGQTLVILLGMANAMRLSAEWGGEHLAVPGIEDYEDFVRKRHVGRMFEKGFGTREIASQMRLSERRVQQICRELEVAGLIPVQGPKKNGGIVPQKIGGIVAQKKGGSSKPAAETGARNGSPEPGMGPQSVFRVIAGR
jgi:hypothetical protein